MARAGNCSQSLHAGIERGPLQDAAIKLVALLDEARPPREELIHFQTVEGRQDQRLEPGFRFLGLDPCGTMLLDVPPPQEVFSRG